MLNLSDLVELLKLNYRRQKGQTMAEYAVVLGIITVATVAVFSALSEGIRRALTSASGAL
ncbi:MAG: hypothetical protein C5B48_03420 [Candidatus Rokuibacteriota bacterium]|nr:MAG: hypothetical protein C5B48_03420 [Candidatus Rokubacteria bacterium]